MTIPGTPGDDPLREDQRIPMPGVLGACCVLAAIIMIAFAIGYGIGVLARCV